MIVKTGMNYNGKPYDVGRDSAKLHVSFKIISVL
jgi:hypothetical protein